MRWPLPWDCLSSVDSDGLSRVYRVLPWEPLINSESFSCAGKIRQIKAPIAGNSQPKAGPMSEAIALGLAKIGNAELAYFNKQMLIHELIRGSLGTYSIDMPGRLDNRQYEPVGVTVYWQNII